jgi:hypothetical protein
MLDHSNRVLVAEVGNGSAVHASYHNFLLPEKAATKISGEHI